MGGQASARSLLVLLLGEYVLPGGRELPARTAVEALGLLGIAEPAARQALRRLAADGWLEPHGRRGQWRLGDAARRFLDESRPRFGRASRPPLQWDGRWLLVRTSVPEEQRALRHRLRTALSFQGFGSLGGGWWVSADAGAEAPAQAVLDRLGVRGSVSFVASSGTIGDGPAAVVAEAWDLAEARARFDKLVAEFAPLAPGDDAAAFASCTRLVDQWRRALAFDPQLPAELLPPDWPGHEARLLFNDRYGRWHPPAAAWWDAR